MTALYYIGKAYGASIFFTCDTTLENESQTSSNFILPHLVVLLFSWTAQHEDDCVAALKTIFTSSVMLVPGGFSNDTQIQYSFSA
jgi:hypothetical protein